MVTRGGDSVVLWPRYFNQRLSRAEGRRVPKALAVREPEAKWIESAAKKAGFDTTLQENAKDPRVPYKAVGRVLVKKTQAKEATIKAVAAKMAEGSPEPHKR